MIRSRNILLCIAGHAINNLLVFTHHHLPERIAASFLSSLSIPEMLGQRHSCWWGPSTR
jgi:hypothetical protein